MSYDPKTVFGNYFVGEDLKVVMAAFIRIGWNCFMEVVGLIAVPNSNKISYWKNSEVVADSLAIVQTKALLIVNTTYTSFKAIDHYTDSEYFTAIIAPGSPDPAYTTHIA